MLEPQLTLAWVKRAEVRWWRDTAPGESTGCRPPQSLRHCSCQACLRE
jgi:hypothetical protein